MTKNRNNSAETIYKHYCGRGEMELWIKDLKYFKADRMSCNSYRANYFHLFLYGAAFVLAHRMKHTVFKGTEVERFNMDSIIKRIMLSAVHIVEKKTYTKSVSRLTTGIGKRWRQPSQEWLHSLTTAL